MIRLKFVSLMALAVSISATGCSSKEKKSEKKSIEKEAVVTSTTTTTTTTTPAKADASKPAEAIRANYNPNELITRISEFIAQHPESSLSDVVNYANKTLSEIGLPFSLIAPNAQQVGAETIVKTEDGKLLNVGLGSEPLCSSGIVVTFPVLSREKGLWIIKYKSGQYQIKGTALRLGEIHQVKGDKLATKIGLPEEGPEPGGISAGGESVFTRFDLTPSASSWWQRIMRRDAREEAPYLVLEVGANDFEFTDEEDYYDNFDYAPKKEELENDSYRLKYENSEFYYQGMSCS